MCGCVLCEMVLSVVMMMVWDVDVDLMMLYYVLLIGEDEEMFVGVWVMVCEEAVARRAYAEAYARRMLAMC